MSDKPIPVAIAAIINNDELLLIKRVRGDYIGYWSLPGGKVDKDEHVSEAATREVFEETGLKAEFKQQLGFVSELLKENGEVQKHFLLHVCLLEPFDYDVTRTQEGVSDWFSLKDIESMRNKIIPSDYEMIEHIIKKQEKNYFDCVVERDGDKHLLLKFE